MVTASTYGPNRQTASYEAIVARIRFSSPPRGHGSQPFQQPAPRLRSRPDMAAANHVEAAAHVEDHLELAPRYRRIARARLDRTELDRELGCLAVPELPLPTMLPSDALTAPPSAAP